MNTFVLVTDQAQIDQVAQLAGEIWQEHYTPIIGEKQVKYMLKKFQSPSAIAKSMKEGYQYYLLCDEQACGYIGVVEDNGLFLSKLYIQSTARGKGLARKSIDFLIADCKERGLDKIWLTCNIHNKNTIAAYQKLGFVIIDTQQADIGEGYIMDDYILTLAIS